MATPSKRRGGIQVDFSGVESGTSRPVPDGNYPLECVSVEEKESRDGNPYLAWKWKVDGGPSKGATIYDNTSLQPQALWRLKGLLECMGVKADGKMALDTATYKGKKVWAEVANETYQGKEKPRIANFLMSDPGGPGEESPAKSLKKGTRVTFEFEGDILEGQVVSLEKDKVIVSTEIDGATEEWELSYSDVTEA